MWTGKELVLNRPNPAHSFLKQIDSQLADFIFLKQCFHIFCKIALDVELISECRTPPASPGKNPPGTKRKLRSEESPQQPKVAAREGAVAPALHANIMKEHPSAGGWQNLKC